MGGGAVGARLSGDSPAAEPGPQPGRPSAGHSQAGAEPAAQFVRHHEFIFLPGITGAVGEGLAPRVDQSADPLPARDGVRAAEVVLPAAPV